MDRKEFISTCGKSCLVILGGGISLFSCAGTKYIPAEIVGTDMIVPLSTFEKEKKGAITFRKYIVAHHENLQYPICIYRISDKDYEALLMRCTHQGTELQVFGDRLQCPAHGSEFSIKGAVQNGPADTNLRTFPVRIENETLKISLT